MITRTTRLALLLAIAALTYAQPAPANAAMDGPELCIRDLEPDENGITCEGCVDLETGCWTAECCVVIGTREYCLSDDGCFE